MKGKIFSPDEANRMLPLVSRIADDIVATYAKVQRALQAYDAEKSTSKPPESAEPAASEDPEREARLGRLDREVARLLERFQHLIEEIEALGGTVKDYERGCIDFYGELEGQIVYLCWIRGESSIAHWHRLEEGFTARRRIEVASAA
jgi:hypothetical protein